MIWLVHFFIVHILLIISIKKRNDNLFIQGTFIYAIFTFGQRWMTGEDFPGYLLYYLINFKGKEIGYFSLQNLFSNYNIYFGLFIFFIYFVTLSNNYKFIKRFNKNTVLLIYLYLFVELFFMQMSQIRQFIAVSFFIHSYYFAYEQKYIKSMINLCLAISLHFATLIVAPILLIKLKLSQRSMFYTMLICYFLPFFNIKLLFELGIIDMYSHYIGSVYDTGLSFFHYIRYYLIITIIIIFIYNMRKIVLTKTDMMIFNGVLFYIIFYGLSFQFAPMMRVSYYFKIFEIILIGYYLNDIMNFSFKLTRGTVISVFLLFYLGIAIIDPYNITRYEFRPLQLYENRSVSELRMEIHNFYYD